MNIHSSANLPPILTAGKLPVVAAPLFIISVPDLVIAQCKAGVIGSFPALNAREKEGEPIELERWLKRITEELDRHNQENPDNPAAPFAVNQIVHRSNPRLMRDIEICVKWNVPVWITSLGARPEVNEAAHSCGGIVLHDIINNTFAKKAIEKGADGLIAVAAGAGGHAGPQSPFALIQEIREWFKGPLLLSGSIISRNYSLFNILILAWCNISGLFLIYRFNGCVDEKDKFRLNVIRFLSLPSHFLVSVQLVFFAVPIAFLFLEKDILCVLSIS